MAKVLRGLIREPTFEDLINTSNTYDFTDDIDVYTSAALNYRQGFFGSALDPIGEVVDGGHDDKTEQVNAQIKAAAADMERRQEARRGRRVSRGQHRP